MDCEIIIPEARVFVTCRRFSQEQFYNVVADINQYKVRMIVYILFFVEFGVEIYIKSSTLPDPLLLGVPPMGDRLACGVSHVESMHCRADRGVCGPE